MFGLSPYMLKSLQGIVEDAKAEPPLHGLAGKSPVNVTPADVAERVVTSLGSMHPSMGCHSQLHHGAEQE